MELKYRMVALLTILLLIIPCMALAAAVGKITALQGNVDITRPGSTAQNVQLNDPINVGDFVRTKSKSKVEITFNEGNVLRLAENTRIRITEYMSGPNKNSSVLNLFRGKIQNIFKTVGAGGRYEVHTPTSVCGVRGTHFFNYHLAGVSGSLFKEGSGYGYSKGIPQDLIPYCIQDNTMIYTRDGGAPCRDKFLSVTKKFNELSNCSISADQSQTTVRPFL